MSLNPTLESLGDPVHGHAQQEANGRELGDQAGVDNEELTA